MQGNLAVIERVIREHQLMRGDIRRVGESTNDLEAALSLQQAYSGWTLSSLEVLDEKQKQLHQMMDALRDGVNKHFAFEEYALPPIFGEVLIQALRLVHQKIRKSMDETDSFIVGTRLAELDQEKLLLQKSHIQQMISAVGQALEEHAAQEEAVLSMAKLALEGKAPGKS